jgi:hypothetical protein
LELLHEIDVVRDDDVLVVFGSGRSGVVQRAVHQQLTIDQHKFVMHLVVGLVNFYRNTTMRVRKTKLDARENNRDSNDD